jgi:hypothetical protein
MRLHGFLTVAALAALVGAPLVAATPAAAFGVWNTPGYSVQVQLPPMLSPWPQMAQVPIFGGPRYFAQEPQVAAVPQTAEFGDTVDHAPTFVAPGVDQNAAGQIEHAP